MHRRAKKKKMEQTAPSNNRPTTRARHTPEQLKALENHFKKVSKYVDIKAAKTLSDEIKLTKKQVMYKSTAIWSFFHIFVVTLDQHLV